MRHNKIGGRYPQLHEIGKSEIVEGPDLATLKAHVFETNMQRGYISFKLRHGNINVRIESIERGWMDEKTQIYRVQGNLSGVRNNDALFKATLVFRDNAFSHGVYEHA